MNSNKYKIETYPDEIIEELWEIKDKYSETCESDFFKLVKNVKKDIAGMHFDLVEDTNIPEVA